MAARSGRDPIRSLEVSVERLAGAFDRLAGRIETLENGIANGASLNGQAAPASDADRVVRHIRRYMPFYALAAVFALFVLFLPSRNNNGAQNSAQQVTSNGTTPQSLGAETSPTTTAGPGTAVSSATGTGGSTGASTASPGQVEVPGHSGPFDPLAWNYTGTTVGGFACKPGVRQLPWSAYAPPCVPNIKVLDNGGKTWTGVDAKTVTIVNRKFPQSASSQAVNAFVAQAGFATGDEVDAADHVFRNYLEKTIELYGRQLKFIDYVSKNGNSTQEALGQGQEGACADADDIISRYHPFMIVGVGSNGGMTGVFGECAATRHVMALGAGAYFPEWWYQKYHPWIFAGVMNCTMIAYQNAEYLGKRVARPTYNATTKQWVNAPAKWAKGLQKNKPRVLGLYVPTNEEYQSCVKIARDVSKSQYHSDIKDQFNYQLDVSRLADQAAQAIARFQADGVTTILLACDPLSPIFLTQDATNQSYFPEWWTNGAGLTDLDQFVRLWDQSQVQHSLFGMSQLGDNAKILGPNGEAAITYKKATGTDIPPGTQAQYFGELGIFSLFQIVGPIITPDRIAAAIWRAPPGGAPTYEVGLTDYSRNPDGTKTPSAWCQQHGVNHGCQHTSVSDMREIYWVCDSISPDSSGASRCSSPKGYDGKGGVYRSTYNGKRFANGEWPTGEPPIYPPGS